MADDTVELVVRLPVELHRALKDRAEADDRSMAATIRLALRQYVAGVGEAASTVHAAAQALWDVVDLRIDEGGDYEPRQCIACGYLTGHYPDCEYEALRDVLARAAAGPQATPHDEVLLEGVSCGYDLIENGVLLHVEGQGRWLDLIDGTRVRVVAAPTGQEDNDA